MEANEYLEYTKKNMDQCLRLKQALEEASIVIKHKAKTLSDSCLEAAEQFRKEAEDWKMQYEETKIHLEKTNE